MSNTAPVVSLNWIGLRTSSARWSASSARAEVAESDAYLPERAEGDREPVTGTVFLVERDAALGQRQRLFVPVLQHHHAGLVAADRRQHVVGLDERGETLGLSKRAHGLVVATEFGERDAGQRVHQREMAAVAGRVEGRGGHRDVLAHDRDVADLAVALSELVVSEPDGARVVRASRRA